jgi:hypothetical protein
MTCKHEIVNRMANQIKNESKGSLNHEQARQFVIKQLERAKRRKEG